MRRNRGASYGIDGGAATMLDLPLNPDKELKELRTKILANDVDWIDESDAEEIDGAFLKNQRIKIIRASAAMSEMIRIKNKYYEPIKGCNVLSTPFGKSDSGPVPGVGIFR